MIHLTKIRSQSKAKSQTKPKLCIACSSGGHLIKAYQLKPWWKQYPRYWVTDSASQSLNILSRERVIYGFFPVQRHLTHFVRNTLLAIKLQLREKPDIILSTGAGIAPPFLLIGKLFGTTTIFIETFSLIAKPTLSGRLCYYLADHFIVQHPGLQKKYPKAKLVGSIL